MFLIRALKFYLVAQQVLLKLVMLVDGVLQSMGEEATRNYIMFAVHTLLVVVFRHKLIFQPLNIRILEMDMQEYKQH